MYSSNLIPQAGQVWLGRFRLEEPLDGGRQALTWRVLELESGAERVLKILPISPKVGHRARRRLAREAEILSTLEHPSLPRALGFHEDRTRATLVLDWVPGRSLREVLSDGGRLSPTELARAIAQLTSALVQCHGAGVIHRDLKPANIIVADETFSRFVLADFGVARLLDVETSGATTVGRVLGTPRYSAPEQLRGEPATPASDLFALAVVAYEMATGRRPWLRDGSGEALLYAHGGPEPLGNDREAVSGRLFRGELIPPSRYRRELAPLDPWFARALSVHPAARFADADAMGSSFRAALPSDFRPADAPRDPRPDAAAWLFTALSAAAVGLAVALGALAWDAWSAEPVPPEPAPKVRAYPVATPPPEPHADEARTSPPRLVPSE